MPKFFALNQKVFSFWLLFVAAILWGTSFLPTQWVLKNVGIYEYLFYRFLYSAIIFFLISPKSIIKNAKNSFIPGAIVGVIMGISFILQTIALPLTASSTVAFLTGTSVVMVPFLAFLINKEKLTFKAIILSLIAGLGVYFFSDAKLASFGGGEFFSLICALGFALVIIYNDKFVKNVHLNSFVFFQFFACALVCALAALCLDKLSLKPLLISGVNYYIFASALVLTVFCFFAQIYAQKYLSAEKVAILLLLEPISAGILGYFYGEIFSTLQIIGAILILIALAKS